MKRLLLLRHAKAVPHGTVNDFDRALDERGRRAAAAVGRRLAERPPDLALVSPAARTRETWELCGLPGVELRLEEAIYEASLGTLLRLVQRLPDEAALPILVGHNPGFEDFAASLASAAPFGGVPTAGLVEASWPVARWREATLEGGRLERLAMPGADGA